MPRTGGVDGKAGECRKKICEKGRPLVISEPSELAPETAESGRASYSRARGQPGAAGRKGDNRQALNWPPSLSEPSGVDYGEAAAIEFRLFTRYGFHPMSPQSRSAIRWPPLDSSFRCWAEAGTFGAYLQRYGVRD
jgi:hypothetical protein